MSVPDPSARIAPSFCVYTTLVGGYEALNEQPAALSSSIPFICFTDDPGLTSQTWQIRQVAPLFPADPVHSQRVIKLRPRDYLPEFAGSLYIDNTVRLKASPEEVRDRYSGAPGFCVFRHSFHATLREEFAEVLRQGLDNEQCMLEQLDHFAPEAPDIFDEQPYWTGILLRDHDDATVRAMQDIWLAYLLRYSRRDQLSINLALRRAGLKPRVLELDNHATWFHTWPHRNNRKPQRQRRSKVTASSAELQCHLEQLQGALAREKAEHESLSTAKGQIEQERNDLRSALAQTQLQNAEMRASTSWRVTSPFRVAGDFAKTSSRKLRAA